MIKENYQILIVDDEKDITDLIADILKDSNDNYEITIANTFEEADLLITNKIFDLVLLDIWLNDQNDGVELLKDIKEKNKNTQVIMISGHGNIKIAVQCIKIGAFDYIEKPFKSDKLRIVVQNAIEIFSMRKKAMAQEIIDDKFTKIIGKSKIISQIREIANSAAQDNSRVFINGDSGTGKELIAKYIHKYSKHKNNTFTTINESSSILNGNFSSFYNEFNGTIFLKEITNFPLHFQKSLLEFIHSTQFVSEAANKFRIISSSSHNVKEMINAGFFNRELYSRLNAVSINLPTLRQRVEDVPELCKFFIEYFIEGNNLSYKEFTEDAICKLQSYEWPGNVAQLKMVIELIMVNNNYESSQKIDSSKINITNISGSNSFDIQKIIPLQLKEAREEFEKYYLLFHLRKNALSISKTAESIGMDRSALHRKLKSLNVDFEDL